MKRSRRGLLGMLLLSVFMLLAAGQVMAEEVKTQLFTLQLRDGYQKYNIPVYEYKEGDVRKIGPESGSEKVIVNVASTRTKVSIKKKTAYFTANYTTASASKKVQPKQGKSKKLTVNAVTADGVSLRTTMRVMRPAAPTAAAELSSQSYTPRSGALKGTLTVKSSMEVSASVKVTKSRKTVYSHDMGRTTDADPVFNWYWDGRDDSGDIVAPGNYRVQFILSYSKGKKTASIVKKIKVKVNEAARSTQNDPADITTPAEGQTWPWVMYISGNKSVDYAAEVICRSILKTGMSETQRAEAIFKWCAAHFDRNGKNSKTAAASIPEKLDVSSATAKANIKAYAAVLTKLQASGKAVVNTSSVLPFSAGNTLVGLTKQCGDCTNMARMYQVLCRHAGLDCDIIQNGLGKDPLHHFWNVVRVDGAYYECDPRMANARGEGLVHCLRGTVFMETLNWNKGNGTDDVRRYSTIYNSAAYKALYAKISKKDCPTRSNK